MGMSKLALNRFIEFLAGQYADQGLMAYSLYPGGVPTRMSTDSEKVPKELHKSKWICASDNMILTFESDDRFARNVRCNGGVALQRTQTLAEW